MVGRVQMHLRHGKTPSDLSNKLLVDKAFTDDNIKRLTNDINQAFPRPQQAFLPIPYDYHVSTSGYMRLQLYHLNRVLNGSAQLSPLKAGSPDDIPNWVLPFLSKRQQRVKLGNYCFPNGVQFVQESRRVPNWARGCSSLS